MRGAINGTSTRIAQTNGQRLAAISRRGSLPPGLPSPSAALLARAKALTIGVAQVWDDFTRFPYLPRLNDSRVLLNAVIDGPQELNAEQDGFGYADA